MTRGKTHVPDADLGLRRAGPVHDDRSAGRLVRGVRRERRSLRPGVGRPLREGRLDRALDVDATEVAGDDERAGVGTDRLGVASDEHVTIDRGHGLRRATERPRVGGAGRVHRLGEGPLDPPTRVGHGLLEVVEALVAQAQHLSLREAGVSVISASSAQSRSEARARHLDVRTRAVPARVRAQLGAQALGRLDELDAVALDAPLGQRACREDRRARLGGVLARRTTARVAANDELCLEERPAGHVREHELQAVVEPRRA